MGFVLGVGAELVELVEELLGLRHLGHVTVEELVELRDLAQEEMGCVLVVGDELVEPVEELLGLRHLGHVTVLG